jgi:CRISPR system Cascade subunit CasA
VTRVLIANGEKLTPQNKVRDEPHTAWRRSEAQEKKPGVSGTVYMPREHDPDRSIWRGLQSLLPGTSSRQRGDAAKFVAPGILEWIGYLGNERVLPPDHSVRVRAIGMVYGSQSSVVEDIVHDTLALRAVLTRKDAGALATVCISCVESAEAAAQAVGGLAGDLVAAAGGDGTGSRSRAMERLYAQLDSPFRSWLLTVGTGPSELELQAAWHGEASRVTTAAARELLDNVPPACWEGRLVRGHLLTAAHAEARFWKSVRSALPFAFPAEPDQPDAAA